MTSLQALLRKAFRSPGVLGDFGIFCVFLPCASREVKINRKCLTCFAWKQWSSATGNNSHSKRSIIHFIPQFILFLLIRRLILLIRQFIFLICRLILFRTKTSNFSNSNAFDASLVWTELNLAPFRVQCFSLNWKAKILVHCYYPHADFECIENQRGTYPLKNEFFFILGGLRKCLGYRGRAQI